MPRKLPPKDFRLHRVADEVLHYLWDPIGVAGNPEARDEYQDYLGQVFELLKEGSKPEVISEYLSKVQSDVMGLQPDERKCLEVATILIRWKRHIGTTTAGRQGDNQRHEEKD